MGDSAAGAHLETLTTLLRYVDVLNKEAAEGLQDSIPGCNSKLQVRMSFWSSTRSNAHTIKL